MATTYFIFDIFNINKKRLIGHTNVIKNCTGLSQVQALLRKRTGKNVLLLLLLFFLAPASTKPAG